ncbi:MAG: hypothetical protein IKK83_01545 [Clostridia bacterium]|nr:hypothetical protein [Clostridia bacterium]
MGRRNGPQSSEIRHKTKRTPSADGVTVPKAKSVSFHTERRHHGKAQDG